MEEQEKKAYIAPAIVIEMELETRAGSPVGEILDELLED